jgi:chemotaxis protein CheD
MACILERSSVQDIDQYPKVFLQTGDCFLGVRPTFVTTVLGSCVAVTMCDPARGIGSICHAFLPDSVSFRHATREPQVCRFVDTALDTMYASMMKLKVSRENLVVKVFGGASGLMGGTERTNLYDIGGRNLHAVRQWLLSHSVPIAKAQIGGNHGRKLHFLTHTGDVWVKLLDRSGGE